jgi:magnesium transporter
MRYVDGPIAREGRAVNGSASTCCAASTTVPQFARWSGASVSEVRAGDDADATVPVFAGVPLPESAGEHIVTHVPLARQHDRVQTVLERIAERAFDSLEAVYVVDESRRFVGAVRLPDLYRASQSDPIGKLMDGNYPRVGPHHDQEQVAAQAYRCRAASVAVVDELGCVIGAVPALSLLAILRYEHIEDLHRLAGIQRENARDQQALEAPATRRARHRLPWLLVGLVGSMLAALVVSRFEQVLKSQLAVAFFVPAIVYLADAIGTQTEAIVVRGLSVSRLSLHQLLAGELRTGVLIGATLAVLSFPIVALAQRDVRLALCVSAAIFAAGGMATSIGLLLPWFLHRMGSDPAFGSGPVATIAQDVLSLLIYFLIVSLVMG